MERRGEEAVGGEGSGSLTKFEGVGGSGRKTGAYGKHSSEGGGVGLVTSFHISQSVKAPD